MLRPPAAAVRKVVMNSASMLSSSSPAARALASQRCRSWRSGPCAASDASVSVRVTNVPTPGPGGHQPVVLELPVGLEHRVRVDRQLRHDVLDRRQLVALAQQAEPQRLPHLLHELQVGETPGPAVQVELDQRFRRHCARRLAQ